MSLVQKSFIQKKIKLKKKKQQFQRLTVFYESFKLSSFGYTEN